MHWNEFIEINILYDFRTKDNLKLNDKVDKNALDMLILTLLKTLILTLTLIKTFW